MFLRSNQRLQAAHFVCDFTVDRVIYLSSMHDIKTHKLTADVSI